ncbi:pyruvate kinase [Flavonifractor sp. An100]|uniref:pyruvate kinase n=1 Tax=Flavonifractor sp. An100 TaxID=1965538 RepID=UPI000B3AF4C8|nr:pyruvate kinase [Flavonifractor sp. An100]OUQ79417.1 pyruvate kinase [Flavonifractor sp. An100]
MEFYGTIGHACSSRDMLVSLFQAGMTGVRLNLSHTNLQACTPLLQEVLHPAARQGGVSDPHLIIDLQGPELRIGQLPGTISLEEGEDILLGDGGVPVPAAVVSASKPGQKIAIDDSALLLQVRKNSPSVLLCRVIRGGILRSRKSLALLGCSLDTPALTPEDLENLDLAGELGVTHILQPFVRGKEDVDTLRQALNQRGLDHVQIMAKIENRAGVEHLDEIMAAADQICIARGDLGNSMPLSHLPRVQKDISRRCRKAGVPFCLVTQLLWSMEQRPVPTRAEVSDIYNGVLDGASSLMLTGETAVGKYPVQAMEYLVNTARQAMEDGAEE